MRPGLRSSRGCSEAAQAALPVPRVSVTRWPTLATANRSDVPPGQSTRTVTGPPLAQAKLQRRVLRGQIAAVGAHAAHLRRRACALDVHQRAEPEPVGGAVVEPHLQPRGAAPTRFRNSRTGPLLLVTTMSVSPSLSRSPKAAPRPTSARANAGPAWLDTSRERPVAEIAEQLVPHPVRHRLAAQRLDDVDGAVGDEQIEPAVVVVVDPVGAEPGEGGRRLRHARRPRACRRSRRGRRWCRARRSRR